VRVDVGAKAQAGIAKRATQLKWSWSARRRALNHETDTSVKTSVDCRVVLEELAAVYKEERFSAIQEDGDDGDRAQSD
jgi:hypothetical protein